MSGTLTPKKNTTKANKLLSILRNYWHVALALLLVAMIGAILAWSYKNQINPDAVSYIQAARYYANFEFTKAINGYWSPLLSWILAPFILCGIDPLYAFRALNFVLGIFVISMLAFVLNNKRLVSSIEKIAQLLYLVTFGIILEYWGCSIFTPDLLSGVVLLATIYSLYSFFKKETWVSDILLGVCLAALYFSKSIGFYLAIAIILLVIIYKTLITKSFTKLTIIPAVTFILLSSLWIGAISLKYNKFTISTAGGYNLALVGPSHPQHPNTLDGYHATAYEDSTTSWDDPSYINIQSWSISQNLGYFMKHVAESGSQSLQYLIATSPLIFFGLYVLFYSRKINKEFHTTAIILLSVSILTICAYSLLLVEGRYLWLIAIPIIFLGGLTTKIAQDKKIIALMLILPILAIGCTTLIGTIQNRSTYQQQWAIKQLAIDSKKSIPAHTKIASPNNWSYCYFSNTRCLANYTLSNDPYINQEIIKTLKSQDINYYVTYDKSVIPNVHIIFREERCGTYLTVYQLN